MAAIGGTPSVLSEQDINARLPSLGGSSLKVQALEVQVKLAQATATILRSEYTSIFEQNIC